MVFFNKKKLNKTDNRLSLSSTDLNLVFDGDSLTFGTGGLGAQDYPNYIKSKIQLLCNSLEFNSFGVSGQSTLDMLSDANTQIDVLVDVDKYNMIVAWEDVNAILNESRTALQNFNDFVTYFTDRKAAGFEYGVLVLGYYPRLKLDGTYNQPTWNNTLFDIQEAYRELVRNAISPPWDCIVDLTEHPIFGGVRGQYLNTGYFNDSVHLTSSGYIELGKWIYQNGVLKPFK